MKDRLEVGLSKELFYEIFYRIESGHTSKSMKMNTLGRPCLICFVATASMESSSTIIFTMISAIIVVGGNLV